MKTIYTSVTVALSLSIFCSCGFLDFDQSLGFKSDEEVYDSWTRTEQSLTQVYTYLDHDFGAFEGATRDCATDDAQYLWTSCQIHIYNNGRWSPINTIDAVWADYYSAIRTANLFIKNFSEADYSKYKWDSTYESWLEKSRYWIAEARFLRSYFLFELAKRYGDIPLATDIYTIEDVNNLKKSSVSEVLNYVASECEEIAETLPVSFTSVSGAQTGRATKGAALALRAKALLYLASPLFSADSQEKWIVAANAAKDVMDMNHYQLTDENSVNNPNSKELILERRMAASNTFEKYNYPITFDKGNTGTCPTQNLVDAFQTNKGYDVILTENGWQCSDPDFDQTKPYNNRDKRFYRSVIYDGSVFKGKEIACHEGGAEGVPANGASPTGYYLKKYIMEDIDLAPTEKTMIHTWVIFRYAEIVINYAEAMNMAYGPDAKGEGAGLTAREALNLIRARADMPPLSSQITSKEDFHAALMREKRVEFALEGHRFWDVRRWKTASESQEDIYGVKIIKDENNRKSYSRILVESRRWDDKKYLYPIPMKELYKNNNLYPQNEGWN